MNLIKRAGKKVLEGKPCLRVMTWNLLADQLAKNFPAVEERFLKWSYRKELVLMEIQRIDADLVMVQEVDRFGELEMVMGGKGFEGVFQQKGGWHRDGVAIFYRAEKFKRIESFVLRFEGSQIAIGLKLKMNAFELYVFTTHLKSRQEFDQERVKQVKDLFELFHKLERLPLVLGGDFNSIPGSCAYEELCMNPFELKSVYNFGSEVEYTTVKVRDKLEVKTEDYLWQSGFEVLEYLEIPAWESIGEKGLPSCEYPSDHFALAANLRFKSI